MVRIQAAALVWAWSQISSGGHSGASAASDTRALLPLLCTHQHDASRPSLAHLLMPAIHPSTWKGASQKFAQWVFSEVQLSDGDRRSVRRVMSSSCSQLSPTKEYSSSRSESPRDCFSPCSAMSARSLGKPNISPLGS